MLPLPYGKWAQLCVIPCGMQATIAVRVFIAQTAILLYLIFTFVVYCYNLLSALDFTWLKPATEMKCIIPL